MINFKVTKPLILNGITAVKTYQNNETIDFTANVKVYKKDETIYDESFKFEKDNRRVKFSTTVFISPNVVHKIIVYIKDLPAYTVDGCTYKRQQIGNIHFIPPLDNGVTESVNGVRCVIQSFEFIDIDD